MAHFDHSEASHATAKGYLLTAALWMVIAALAGLIAATELIAPDLITVPWLIFGRLRAIHVNLVIFGFVAPGLFATAFIMMPRLLRTPLYSERLGIFSVVAWNMTLAAIVITLAMGHSQGREYAEMVWGVDVAVVAALLLIFYNLAMTVKHRREPLLFVSVWYVLAGLILTAATYALGNVVWRPSTGALAGIPDAIILWFYGHNIFGLFLTPLAIAAAYYVIPRAVRAPLYSHTLSLLGFWGLIVVYTHIGTHHLLQVPVPQWLKVVAVVDSVAMVIPVTAFLVNIWYTAQGRLGEIHADIAAKFVFTGTIMYFFVSIQGSMMSLPSVQRVTHFNNWVVGHAHIGVLGFSGMIAIGGVYHILPMITQKPLYSRLLADLQYWLILIGVSGFAVVLTIVGLIQGNAWLNGETVYRVLPQLHMYYVARASLGLMIVVGALVGLYNMIRTFTYHPKQEASS